MNFASGGAAAGPRARAGGGRVQRKSTISGFFGNPHPASFEGSEGTTLASSLIPKALAHISTLQQHALHFYLQLYPSALIDQSMDGQRTRELKVATSFHGY